MVTGVGNGPLLFMKIRVLNNVLVGGQWHEPGVGNYTPELAKHLIELGVAEPYETKVIDEIEVQQVKKPQTLGSASLPAQASREKTAKRSGKAGSKL